MPRSCEQVPSPPNGAQVLSASLAQTLPGMSWRVGFAAKYTCDVCRQKLQGERWHCAQHYRDVCGPCGARAAGPLCQLCGVSTALDARLSLEDFSKLLERSEGGVTSSDVQVCFRHVVGADGKASVNDLVVFLYPEGPCDKARDLLRSSSLAALSRLRQA